MRARQLRVISGALRVKWGALFARAESNTGNKIERATLIAISGALRVRLETQQYFSIQIKIGSTERDIRSAESNIRSAKGDMRSAENVNRTAQSKI